MKTLTLVLLALLITSCVSSAQITTNNAPIRTISTQTVIRTLPFDPEKILKTWKPIAIDRYEGGIAVVTMGNPSIVWCDENIVCAFDQPIPEGNIASAVAITLFRDPRKGVLLIEFWFINPLGILEFYAYDKDIGKFVRQPHHTQKTA